MIEGQTAQLASCVERLKRGDSAAKDELLSAA
jgi:hypothetical protein